MAIALPLLEAMLPAGGSAAAPGQRRPRLIAIEMVHGAAGSTAFGRSRNLWSPAEAGRGFELTPALRALEPFRDKLTIVSNTRLSGAEAHSPDEEGDGVDHARSSAAFLTGGHPLRNAKGLVSCGPSLDQLFARHVGRRVPIASLELSIEPLNEPADATWPAGYDPVYRHAISWRDARTPVLPEASMRGAFARLFGAKASAGDSVLDAVLPGVGRLKARLSASDRASVDAHLANIRDLERRIAGLAGSSSMEAPSFVEQFRVMSDLVTLALAADLTRAVSLKLGLDRSQRVYAESGVGTPFHKASHHRQEPEKILEFAKLNAFHVTQIAYLLGRLAETQDEGQSLLARSLVLYGSPMGDSHVHAHTNLPVFLVGNAEGSVGGNRHVVAEPGTPFANLLLTVARRLDLPLQQLGDSSGELAI